ncbi:MAG: hypothetical protein EBT79_07425, partial [Actinobacteria bacterium]|nr:hypothetical protein [Actinomycetota bacterium]
MQPAVESRTVTARGVASAASFGMRSENSAHIFNILRSTLYSNKVLAVLREYSANAWDEHRAAGIPDRPIKVVIPTALEPTLRIRDYGRGLSEQQVFEVYTQYGSSTKRDSDDVVGCLGIGCLLEGQPIVTLSGMTPVEQVKVGDLVLTHRGRYRRVYETMTRHHVGKACRIYLVQNNKPLVLTSEHPVLVSNHLGDVRWERPCDIVGGYRSRKKGVGSWNTYAVLPATLVEESGTLDVRAVLGPQYEWVDGVCTRTTKFTNFGHKGKPNVNATTRVTRYHGLPESVPLTEEVGWLLGLYAAEGSATTKMVVVSLSINEGALAERFSSGMRDTFGLEFKAYRRPEKSTLELVAHSVPHAALLSALCGKGAKNKHVPEVVFLGTSDVRKGFLRGVFDGDGSSTRSRFVFGVASPDLAWGVRTLMHVTEGKWGSVGHLPEYGRWSVHYKRDAKWSYAFQKGDYVLRPIERVEHFDLDADVFNFSVEEDESYISDFVLHNSKSAFAYADAFTVTSWHGGSKSVYVAVLDETNVGTMSLIHREPCDPSETGVEVSIAVVVSDCVQFRREAEGLFP